MVRMFVHWSSASVLTSVHCFDDLFSQQTYIDRRCEVSKSSVFRYSDSVDGTKQAILSTTFVLLRFLEGVDLGVVEKL